MNEDTEAYIEERGDFSRLSAGTKSLWLVGQTFNEPFDAAELKKLGALKSLQQLSARSFKFPLVDLLNAVPPTFLWKLSLARFPSFDPAMLAALTRFKRLIELSVTLPFKESKLAAYEWASLGELTHLLELDLGGSAPFVEAWINAVKAPKLQSVSVTSGVLTDGLWQAVSKIPALESASFYVKKQTLDMAKVHPIPSLKSLWVSIREPEAFIPWRTVGVNHRFVKIVKSSGKIGDWYQKEKEGIAREFCGEDGFEDEQPHSLMAGEELKITDSSGTVLFNGPLAPIGGEFDDDWIQQGVAPETWEKWFAAKLPAELTTYVPLDGRHFTIMA